MKPPVQGYHGVDDEGFSWEDRMKKRPSSEIANYRGRSNRKKKFRNPLDDMVVPGSVRTSNNVGLV